MTNVFRYCYSTYIYVSYNEALGEWIKSNFFIFFFTIFSFYYLHTKHANNTICTGMLFIAKWEKLYSSELFISFNRTKYFLKIGYNISKTLQHVFFLMWKRKKNYQIILSINFLFILSKQLKLLKSFLLSTWINMYIK